EAQKQRKALHQRSAFESGPGHQDLSGLDPEKHKALNAFIAQKLAEKPRYAEHRLPSGLVMQVPMLSEADHLAVHKIFARVSPEKRAELERQAKALGKALYAEARRYEQLGD